MPTRTFRILGSVADANTQEPVPNLLVQASDTTETQTVLGSGTTDGQGHFQIDAEAEVPTSGIIPANLRVFQGTQPLSAVGDTSIPNLFGFDRTAALQVQIPQVDQPLTDHVTVNQVFTSLNFLQQSDFGGVFREGRDRTSSIGSVLMDSAKTAIKSVKMPGPLQAPTIRNRDVIGQDPVTAQRNLEQQNAAVTSVQAYQPGTQGLSTATSLGTTIQSGDKVDLYTDNNVVKAYKITRANSTPAALLGMGGQNASPIKAAVNLNSNVTALQANVRDLQARTQDLEQLKVARQADAAQLTALQQKVVELDQLQAKFTAVQQESAQKDQVITTLQGQISALQETQKSLSQITPERIAALEIGLRNLQSK